MKKTLAIICAVALALSMFASFAYVIRDPGTAKNTQLAIVDIRAVDYSNTLNGVRPIGNIDKSTKVYQEKDEIEIAVIFEIYNTANAKYASYMPLDVMDPAFAMEVIVDCPTVDLSYAATNAKRVASDLYVYGNQVGVLSMEGDTTTYLSTNETLIGNPFTYNDDGTLSFYVVATNRAGTLLQQQMYYDVRGGAFVVPAYYNKGEKLTVYGPDGRTPVAVLSQTAPEKITYAVIFMGRAKAPNAANLGELKVKYRLSSAQKWATIGFYVYKSITDATKVAFSDIRALELDTYTVYHFSMPVDAFMDISAATTHAAAIVPYYPGNLTNVPTLTKSTATVAQAGTSVGFVNAAGVPYGITGFTLPYVNPMVYDFSVTQNAKAPFRAAHYSLFPTMAGALNAPVAAALAGPAGSELWTVGGVSDVKVTDNGVSELYPYTAFLHTTGGMVPAHPVAGYVSAAGRYPTGLYQYESANGIGLFTIVSTLNGECFPLVTLATEEGPDYCRSIAAFDALGNRVVESRQVGFSYENIRNNGGTVGSGTIPGSSVGRQIYRAADAIAAMRFFEFDTGFSYIYKIEEADFTKSAKAAVYADAIVNDYSYGTITILPANIDEGTDDESLEGDETDVDDTTEVADTGDVSANIAIAIVAAAIVAAAALAFVLKKAR